MRIWTLVATKKTPPLYQHIIWLASDRQMLLLTILFYNFKLFYIHGIIYLYIVLSCLSSFISCHYFSYFLVYIIMYLISYSHCVLVINLPNISSLNLFFFFSPIFTSFYSCVVLYFVVLLSLPPLLVLNFIPTI